MRYSFFFILTFFLAFPGFSQTDVPTINEPILTIPYGFEPGALCLTFSPDGKLLAGFGDGAIRIIRSPDVSYNDEIVLIDPEAAITAIHLSPDNQIIITGNAKGQLKLWDFETNEFLQQLGEHDSPIREVAWSPDGSFIISGSDNGVALLWDANSRTLLERFPLSSQEIIGVGFSSDSSRFFAASSDGVLRLYDSNDPSNLIQDLQTNIPIYTACLSPNADRIAACGEEKILLWEKETNEWNDIIIREYQTPGAACEFSSDGKSLYVAMEKAFVYFDIETRERHVYYLPEDNDTCPITDMAVSDRFLADNSEMVYALAYRCGKSRPVEIRTTKEKQLVSTLRNPSFYGQQHICDLSEDGSQLLLAMGRCKDRKNPNYYSSILIRDPNTGEIVQEFKEHGEWGTGSFLPGSKQFISGSNLGLRLWDISKTDPVFSYPDYTKKSGTLLFLHRETGWRPLVIQTHAMS